MRLSTVLNRVILFAIEGPAWWCGPALVFIAFAGGGAIGLGWTPMAVFQFALGLLLGYMIGLVPGRGGLIGLLFITPLCIELRSRPVVMVSVAGCYLLGVAWCIARRSQFNYFKTIARENGERCPVCGYDRRGNAASICPECGTDVSAYLQRVRHATGVDPSAHQSPRQ